MNQAFFCDIPLVSNNVTSILALWILAFQFQIKLYFCGSNLSIMAFHPVRPLRIPVLAFLILVVLVCLFVACGERQTGVFDNPSAEQYAYFPLSIGKYIIWQVDSVVYDFAPAGGISRDSSTTFVQERISDTLRDNTGQLIYEVERYERTHVDSAWVLATVNTAGRNNAQAFKTEQNFKFLKLIFPLDKRSEWDGHIWIDEDREIEINGERMRPFLNWSYEVDSIDVPASIGAFRFDSTLVVTEADDTNIIEKRLARVRYAKHIGLVQREQWILDSQYCNQSPAPPDCETRPWEIKAERGYILRQTIIGFN